MPPLNKEMLIKISTGKIPDRLKFVSFRTNSEITPHVIYVAPVATEHLDIREEFERDVYTGKFKLPEDPRYEDFDAGRIMTTKGAVLFYGYSAGIELGNDPHKREETGLYARDGIGRGEIPVEWETD